MATRALSRKERIAIRRKKERRNQIAAMASVIVGIGLVVGALLALHGSGASELANFEYGPQDIATDSPFQAVHEMQAGPPIPFLPKDGPQPQLAVGERFHDFGSVGPTEVVSREFVVANLGDAPLTISRAYTTCGCTTADFSSSVIPPGKVVLVNLRFDAGFHDTRGQTVRRGIIIENNDPDRPSAEIWIEASVRSN